ncbi:MAG: hypothetical protein SOZ14_01385 [Candidatus Pseudoscilispira sp.]|nr:hypothetical protein [Candidatus Pseudoscilispira sp.]
MPLLETGMENPDSGLPEWKKYAKINYLFWPAALFAARKRGISL